MAFFFSVCFCLSEGKRQSGIAYYEPAWITALVTVIRYSIILITNIACRTAAAKYDMDLI